MDHHEEYRDHNMSSPHSYADSQWGPPPQFQDHDHIQPVGSPPQGFSPNANSPLTNSVHAHSPPAPVVTPISGYQPQQGYQQGHQQGYQQGYQDTEYSTEKETPYATYNAVGSPTPDYSGPQVVPGQFTDYPHGGRPMSPSTNGGTTIMSPHVRPYGFKEHVDPNDHYDQYGAVPPPVPPKDDRRCGMKKRVCMILFGCVLIWILALALGLGLGLGLGLKKKSSDNTNSMDPLCKSQPEYCIGGTLNSKYLSNTGAYNGSGLALAGESWSAGQRRIFTLFYQHHTGDIRFMQYNSGQQWVGGSAAETVATDAKPGTPLSVVSFALNTTYYFHLFYLDRNSTVKQLTKSNVTDIWQQGPLSSLNLKAFVSPSVGLQACWKGNFYGDSDYSKFPTSSGLVNTVPFDEKYMGMDIWYAIDDSTFIQYAWYVGQPQWVQLQRWQGFNGHAGVGCYSWGDGTSTYAMLANKQNNLEMWWKDTNSNLTSTETHPINSWVNGTKATIDDVYPTSPFGFTTYFYAQMADRSIKGYNVTFQAENTTWLPDQTFAISNNAGPVKALGGTHMSVTAYAEKDPNDNTKTLWDSLYVFFQQTGNDITVFTRPLAGGEWTGAQLNLTSS